MGFLVKYSAVFNAVKSMLTYVPAIPYSPAVPAHDDVPEIPEVLAAAASGVASLGTVILGEAFTLGDLPKAIINAVGAPINIETLGSILRVKANFEVILVIRDYEPKDWFTDIIPVMADVVDAILANQSLGGIALDCIPTGFFPGEVKFDDKVLFGGKVTGYAEYLYRF